MEIIDKKITLAELNEISNKMFGNLVKAVVDVRRGLMAVDAPMHADEEALLIKNGSRQEDLWGINLYPQKIDNDFIEFDSMINLRPSADNRTRGVDDPNLKKEIIKIVNKLISR